MQTSNSRDVNKRPFQPQICYHGLYVAFSRVKNCDHIRILPLQPMAFNLNYLEQLKPLSALMKWAQGYNLDGVWSSSNIPHQDTISVSNKRKRKDDKKKSKHQAILIPQYVEPSSDQVLFKVSPFEELSH